MESPHKSTRKLSQETGVCMSAIQANLFTNKFHPYKVQLHDDDEAHHMEYCEWFIQKDRWKNVQ